MFASPFQKTMKDFTELEFRKGITAGAYSFTRVRFGSLKKKYLVELLEAMREITNEVPQLPSQTQTTLPVGNRKFPAVTGYVSH